eukprot:gene7089-7890_t
MTAATSTTTTATAMMENMKDSERFVGHKYMTSYVQHKSNKYSSKSLPLSIANILGHVDSSTSDEEARQSSRSRPASCSDASENTEHNDTTREVENDDDMHCEVDIEGAEDITGNKFHDETEDNKQHEDMKIIESSPSSNSAEKQSPSYTAIIAQAILSAPDKKLPLGSIYDYIAEHFPEFLKKGQGWRNCVRHNLSLSECFIKAGRARNGRGNYWGIHPRYLKNFSKGDFRKRRASHRPRNRDFGIGLAAADRLNYSHFLNPFLVANNHPASGGGGHHRSFSVESLLSPERGYSSSAFDSYRTRLTKAEANRIPGLVCAPTIPSWIEHKPIQQHGSYHGFIDRGPPSQTPCSCNMYCWTRA